MSSLSVWISLDLWVSFPPTPSPEFLVDSFSDPAHVISLEVTDGVSVSVPVHPPLPLSLSFSLSQPSYDVCLYRRCVSVCPPGAKCLARTTARLQSDLTLYTFIVKARETEERTKVKSGHERESERERQLFRVVQATLNTFLPSLPSSSSPSFLPSLLSSSFLLPPARRG